MSTALGDLFSTTELLFVCDCAKADLMRIIVLWSTTDTLTRTLIPSLIFTT